MKPFVIRLAVTFTTITSLSIFAVACADQLLIEAIRQEPPNTLEGLPRPGNGTLQSEVLQAFGEPRAKNGPVGKPPITRWEYEEFTVVFENDRVVQSVPKLIAVPPESLVDQQ